MAKVLVFGAGLMGRALAYDFCRQSNIEQVKIVELDPKRLQSALKVINSRKAIGEKLDISNDAAVKKALKGFDLAVGAVSYQFNEKLARACIESGAHFLDLGGNDAIVDATFKLNDKAKKAGVTIIPDCGLAPGLAGILGMHVYQQFDKCEEVHLRVGGLPQNPQPPLNYMLVFSVHGLINEYKEPVRIIENGKLKTVPGMSGLEKIAFPKNFGPLEAFYTSGGVSTLVKTLEGKIKNLDYKTIRYQGHQEKIQLLMDLGLFDEKSLPCCKCSPRDVTEHVLEKLLTIDDEDCILCRVWGVGKQGRDKVQLTYEFIDGHDRKTGLTAMMRTTAFPAAIIGNMILKGDIKPRGVHRQELVVPAPLLIAELALRDIDIKVKRKVIKK